MTKAKAVPPHATKALGDYRRYNSYSFLTSALDGGGTVEDDSLSVQALEDVLYGNILFAVVQGSIEPRSPASKHWIGRREQRSSLNGWILSRARLRKACDTKNLRVQHLRANGCFNHLRSSGGQKENVFSSNFTRP
jgi:hypothetical protein